MSFGAGPRSHETKMGPLPTLDLAQVLEVAREHSFHDAQAEPGEHELERPAERDDNRERAHELHPGVRPHIVQQPHDEIADREVRGNRGVLVEEPGHAVDASAEDEHDQRGAPVDAPGEVDDPELDVLLSVPHGLPPIGAGFSISLCCSEDHSIYHFRLFSSIKCRCCGASIIKSPLMSGIAFSFKIAQFVEPPNTYIHARLGGHSMLLTHPHFPKRLPMK